MQPSSWAPLRASSEPDLDPKGARRCTAKLAGESLFGGRPHSQPSFRPSTDGQTRRGESRRARRFIRIESPSRPLIFLCCLNASARWPQSASTGRRPSIPPTRLRRARFSPLCEDWPPTRARGVTMRAAGNGAMAGGDLAVLSADPAALGERADWPAARGRDHARRHGRARGRSGAWGGSWRGTEPDAGSRLRAGRRRHALQPRAREHRRQLRRRHIVGLAALGGRAHRVPPGGAGRDGRRAWGGRALLPQLVRGHDAHLPVAGERAAQSCGGLFRRACGDARTCPGQRLHAQGPVHGRNDR